MTGDKRKTAVAAPLKPRARSKVNRILIVAGALFREHGFGPTTMEAVAAAADVSKATLYQYFANKRELFGAVIAASDDVHSHAMIADGAGQKVPDMLLRLARIVLDLLLAPDTVSAYRMVVAEAVRFPDLAGVYYEKGAARLLTRLEEIFAAAMQRGELRTTNARRAAEQFVGLVRGDLQLRALLGLQRQITARHREAVLRAGVETFCKAYIPAEPTADPTRGWHATVPTAAQEDNN
jgi:AcrR family transcriptional regulator